VYLYRRWYLDLQRFDLEMNFNRAWIAWFADSEVGRGETSSCRLVSFILWAPTSHANNPKEQKPG
jgi:hypothetical protein